jgi:hypothetical protein
MLVHFLTTYDLSVPLNNLVAWDKTGALTAQQVRATYVNLLRFSASDRRAQFRQQFTQVRLAGETALTYARKSRSEPLLHLWNTSEIPAADEQELIAEGNAIESSFGGTTVTLGTERVNLAKFLSATASLRDWLPVFSRNTPVAGTLPDPSFGGIFPDLTATRTDSLFAKLWEVVNLGTFAGYVGHFLSGLSPAERGQNADPDHDQRDNFAEYCFGGDPSRADLPSQVAAIAQTSGGDVTDLRLSFSRRRDLTDVTYVVAVSDDLMTWDRSQATATMVGLPILNEDSLTETVNYSVQGLAGARPPRFVRLEATLNTVSP